MLQAITMPENAGMHGGIIGGLCGSIAGCAAGLNRAKANKA